MEFALVHQAVFVHVHKLDGILNGQDVIVALAVDFVDHGGEGGGFSGTGRPRHQHQTTRLVAKLADDRGQPKLIEGFDFEWNKTKHGSGCATLIKYVGAEA